MKTTRRGLFAWLSALTGAAAVSRVAPAETAPKALPALSEVTRGKGGVEDVLRVEGSLFAKSHPVHRLEIGRRSGRTTRALLRAMDDAKTGERVLFIVHHTAFCDEAYRLLVKHAKADLITARGNGRGYCFNVRGGGTIDIVAAHRVTHDVLRGRTPPVVIRDHRCYELGV